MKNINRAVAVLLMSVIMLTGWGAVSWAQTYVMSTGNKSGLYYPVGSSLADLFNASGYKQKIEVQTSQGSIANLQALQSGQAALAICQADTALAAYQGKLAFQNKKKFSGLRALFSLHNEVLTVVAREESGIKKLADIKGKKVAVGEKGSGTLENTQLALSLVGLSLKDLGQALNLDNKTSVDMFKKGQLDAIFFTVGHPNQMIADLSRDPSTHVYLVPIPKVLDKVMLKNDYYVLDWISVVHYQGIVNQTGVDTFGIKALLVTNQNTPKEFVDNLINMTINKYRALRRGHGALARFSPDEMVRGVSIPFHPEAKRILTDEGYLF